ncbi:MAG: response regulator transcription factor [Clostridia bacterium]|nr:response regulator transcription factor [Clostridia bacterium]
MTVLIATKDSVFCRMLTLEFSDKGFSVLRAQTTAEMEEAIPLSRLALVDADFLAEGTLPQFPYDIILFGYAETFDRIPTQELTKYYSVVRPFAIEDFFANLLVPEDENGAIRLRVPKRKSPSESLALDVNAHAAYYKGEKISLTQKEFALLSLLFENRGTPISREEAHRAIFSDAGAGTNVVDVYVNYLRAKIDHRFGVRMISTVRGCGYTIRK